MKRYALWTNDVETTSIWYNELRDETGRKVMDVGLPLLLDLYDKYSIRTTFFVTGYIAKLIPGLTKELANRGHEIGSHGLSHTKNNGFDVMPYSKQIQHLSDSKKLLEDQCGKKVISFRAPALRVSPKTASALIETGFLIDSSVASQRFDLFLSYGAKTKLKWFYAPRRPYRVDANNIFSAGSSNLIEVPLSAMIIPYVGTLMRISPTTTNIIRSLLNYESGFTGKPIVFDIHPNEFIDESEEPRTISRRSKSRLSYLFRDQLRAKMKTKNLGLPAIELYERQLAYFDSRGYLSCSLSNYCAEEGLI